MGFLQEYEAPFAADARQTVLRHWFALRRQELFAELRAQQPIFKTPDFFLVTRHQDVVEVFTHDDFTVAPYREAGSGDFVLGLDNPAHDHERKRLENALQWTQARLTQDESSIRRIVAKAASQVIDAARSHGQLDLPTQFGRHVPLQVVTRYLFGVQDDTHAAEVAERVGAWTRDLFRAFFYGTFGQYVAPNPLAEILLTGKAEQARREFGAYVTALAEQRRRNATSLIGRMLGTASFDIPALVRNLIGLINGTVDNINVFLTQAMAQLLSRPRELAEAVAAAHADQDDRLRRSLWEALRFNAHPFALPRTCRHPHVFHAGTPWETVIPAGERVFAVIGSAMMDETVIDEPSHFNLERPEEQYLYFGPPTDIHVCLGKRFAEILLVTMAQCVLRLDGLRRADGPDGELQYEEGLLKGFTVAFRQPARTGSRKAVARSQPPPSPARVQHPLTAIMTIKQPLEIHANALKLLLSEKFAQVKALLDRAGTVHFARFVFLENDSELALITTYDGSFDTYIKTYIEQAGELFDAMLVHMQGAPPLPVRQYRQEFIDYVEHANVPAHKFYSAYPTLTVQNIRGQDQSATRQTPVQEPQTAPAGAVPDTSPPRLDLADIQGLILHDYPMSYVRHFFFKINQAAAARRCIDTLLGTDELTITTAALQGSQPAGAPYYLNIGFTYAGLQALELPQDSLASFAPFAAFRESAVARATVVGDIDTNAPEHWEDALRNPQDVHMLLFLYARDRDILEAKSELLRHRCMRENALSELPFPHEVYDGVPLPDPDTGSPGRIIHFGYRDGISQPSISGAPPLPVPEQSSDLQPISSPAGAFLLGYPSQWKDFHYPVPRPPQFGRNGSFAAFRLLEQDVAAFEQYLEDTAKRVKKTKLANEIEQEKEKIAAQLCGRWRNGVPLVLSPLSSRKQIPREQWNSFDYARDQEGQVCPFHAHMRRTNPRGDGVAGADGHQHRVIRRGMPYGPPYAEAPEKQRGLLGVFICASLEDQFEFLMANWINQGGFRPGVPSGDLDPLFGSNPPGSGFSRFVTTRGAAYCFLPSLTALRYIASLESGVLANSYGPVADR